MNELARPRTRAVDGHGLVPAEPLWQRAPARDAGGHPVADFMMLIPRLAARPAHDRHLALARLQRVFEAYGSAVVFADVNVRLNVLWVSVDGPPGLCGQLSAAIREVLPEARLVAQPQGVPAERDTPRRRKRLARTRRWLALGRLLPGTRPRNR